MTVVAFASGSKGGTGKTTLASLLSYHVASTGRKVLLIDLGESGSSTSLTLGEPEPPTINDYLAGRCDWRDVVAESPYSQNLLVAPSTQNIGRVEPEKIARIIRGVSRSVKHVVIDLPAYPGSLYDDVVALGEVVVAVLNPDKPSYEAVREWVLGRRGLFEGRLLLPVLNKYTPFDAEWRDRCEDDFKAFFTVPLDPALTFKATGNVRDAYALAKQETRKQIEQLAYRIEKPLLKVTG